MFGQYLKVCVHIYEHQFNSKPLEAVKKVPWKLLRPKAVLLKSVSEESFASADSPQCPQTCGTGGAAAALSPCRPPHLWSGLPRPRYRLSYSQRPEGSWECGWWDGG